MSSSTEAVYDSDSPIRGVSETNTPSPTDTPSTSLSRSRSPAAPAPPDFIRIRRINTARVSRYKIFGRGTQFYILYYRATAFDRVRNPGGPPPMTVSDGMNSIVLGNPHQYAGVGGTFLEFPFSTNCNSYLDTSQFANFRLVNIN